MPDPNSLKGKLESTGIFVANCLFWLAQLTDMREGELGNIRVVAELMTERIKCEEALVNEEPHLGLFRDNTVCQILPRRHSLSDNIQLSSVLSWTVFASTRISTLRATLIDYYFHHSFAIYFITRNYIGCFCLNFILNARRHSLLGLAMGW